MNTPATPSDPAKHLEEVLEREATFRLQAIHDAHAASTKIKRLEEELEETRQELGRRNSYIHQLHLGKAEEAAAREELVVELGEFSRLLQTAEDRLLALERRSRSWSECFAVLGRASKALVTGGAPQTTAPHFAPPGDFTYYLYTSPYRIYRTDKAKLRGWCYSRDGRQVTALRARLDNLEFAGTCGLDEPEVLKVHTSLAPGARPGFVVEFPISPGRHMLSLEACLDNREWQTVLITPLRAKGQ